MGQTITGALANIPFPFGIDSEGNYGYKKAGADTVTPFKSGMPDSWISTMGTATSYGAPMFLTSYNGVSYVGWATQYNDFNPDFGLSWYTSGSYQYHSLIAKRAGKVISYCHKGTSQYDAYTELNVQAGDYIFRDVYLNYGPTFTYYE